MPYLLACPSCQRQLRIQDEYAGSRIACPGCDSIFVAPPAMVEALPVDEPEGSTASNDAGEYWIEAPHSHPPLDFPEYRLRPRSRKRQRAKAAVLPPAICLIVVGALTFFFHAGAGAFEWVDDELPPAQQARARRLDVDQGTVRSLRMCCYVAWVLGGAYVAIAGLYMLSLRGHSFVLSAAYIVMVPCCTGIGCFLGLPFGIWSLIVLYNHEVRSCFR